MSKFTKEYLEHLEAIEEAQKKFEMSPNTDTATKLSGLKNREFKEVEEVFTKKHITKKTKGLEPENYSLDITYKPGLYNHEAEGLRVIEYEE